MKRRVIAIAVVLAAVTLCVSLWMNDGPLWRAVMLKRVLDVPDSEHSELKWVPRWGKFKGMRHGPTWWLYSAHKSVRHSEWENGNYKPGCVVTSYLLDGKTYHQFRLSTRKEWEPRESPPWWPHPPLIDLKEFEQ